MSNANLKLLAVAVAVSMLASCGGDDDSVTVEPTQTAIGTISGFGSVIVNGVRFDDANASVSMDDATRSRDQLRVGMVVRVRGRIHGDGTGVAESIQYNDCVQGPITAMNQVRNTVTVLGQTVQLDEETVFDGVTLRDMNGFAVGDQVEVSCLPDPANNQFRATRMEFKERFQNGISELEVKGVVANLDNGRHVHDQRVDGELCGRCGRQPPERAGKRHDRRGQRQELCQWGSHGRPAARS